MEKCIGLMDDIILANLNLVCNMGKFVDSIVIKSKLASSVRIPAVEDG